MNEEFEFQEHEFTDPNMVFTSLQPELMSRRMIHLGMNFSCQPSLNGYLLGLSEQLGLMHCFHDFLPDGYTVFPLAQVVEISSDEHDRHWDYMLTKEGSLGGLDQQLDIDLTNFHTAIKSIHDHYSWMIIEAQPDEENEEFYIGQLDSIQENAVRIHHFDGEGNWGTDPAEIPLNEIAVVQFETPYIKTFRKYLNGPCPTQQTN